MPRRIARSEALARIEGSASCIPCAWVADPRPLATSEHAVAVLTPYPVRWGHVIVALRAHRESVGAIPPAEWLDASRLAHAAAVAVERTFDPARCYVASLGSSRRDLPMTFPHVHLHVIPVEDPNEKPADVLTWKDGVYAGDDDEWEALRERLASAWPVQ